MIAARGHVQNVSKQLVQDKRSSLFHLADIDEEKKHIFIILTVEECGAG